MKINFIATVLFTCAVFFTSSAQLLEDFESNKLTWTESPAKGIWQIGKPLTGLDAFDGAKLLGTNLSGPYITSEDVSITSSVFTIPTPTSSEEKYYLEFAQWVQLNTLAYGTVKVSTVDGLVVQSYSIANYYSSDNSSWTYQALDVSQFSGKQVKLSFLLDVYSDKNYDNVSNLGWYIDQINIRSSVQSALKPALLTKLNDVGIVKNSTFSQGLNFKYKDGASVVQFEIQSSNGALLPIDSVKIITSNNIDFTLSINPLKDKTGSSEVTVLVKSGTHSSSQKFNVYVGTPQIVSHEGFETDELLFWKREPENGKLWRIGDVRNGPKSGYLSKKALAMSLEQNYRSSEGSAVKFVSNSIQLQNKETGTYSLSFKSWMEMLSCCGDRGLLKVRLENGKEIELANYYQITEKSWKELRFSLSQFEGQRIQIVFEAQLYGASYFTNSLSGWFIDDLKIEFIGNQNISSNKITLNHIDDVYLFDDKNKEVLIYASNNTNKEIALSFTSSNSSVLPVGSLVSRGQFGTWVLDVKANQIGTSIVKVKASIGFDSDSLTFRVIRARESQKDSLVLLKIYDALGYASTTINWKNGPIKTWEGVVVNASGRVISLTISNKMISGYLPEELGLLDSLKILNANNSKITGEIPKSIGRLSVLENLNLNSSKFTGQIPKEIGQLKKLKILNMSSNYLTGEIPDELGGLESLEELNFSWGTLKTEFPVCLYRLQNLKKLQFNVQSMYGTLPTGIGNLQKLELIELRIAGLTGPIPEDITALTKLKKIDFISNNFTSIPSNIGNMTDLEELVLQNNSISHIPESIKNLKKLKVLNLANNKLSGGFPEIITEVISLESVALNSNMLKGKVPDSIEKLVNLKGIGLSQNQFTSVSSKITNLTKLTGLHLNDNLFTTVPDFSGMTSMTELLLSSNFLGFADFEANISKFNKYYVTQNERPISVKQSDEGGTITLYADVSGVNNLYQWYKNDTLIPGKNSSELVLVNLKKSDQARYQCYVSNAVVSNIIPSGLIIKSAMTNLFINTLGNQNPIIADTDLYLPKNTSYTLIYTLKKTDQEGDALTYIMLSKNMGDFRISEQYNLYLYSTYAIMDTLDIIKLLVTDKKGGATIAYVKVHYDLTPVTYIPTREFNFEISEDVVPGTKIGKVYTYDNSGSQLTYSFSSVVDTNLFKIDSKTGELSLGSKAYLDFDKVNYYSISVRAQNGNGLSSSFSVFIEVKKGIRTPYNFKPIAEAKTFVIHKDNKLGSFVGQLVASDFEKDAMFYYFHIKNDRFNLSPDGVVSLKKTGFNPAIDTVFTLSVVVSDVKNGKDYFDVKVKIDFTERGIVSVNQSFTVFENQNKNALIGKVIASEKSGATLSYKVLEGSTKVPFAFESSTSSNLIVIDSAALDFETVDQFKFDVEISSVYGHVLVVSITVKIKDVVEVVGIESAKSEQVSLYPTLVEDFLTIQSNQEDIQVINVFDANGRLVLSKTMNDNMTQLDFSKLSQGTYQVNVQLENQMIQNKIIKQ
jgi:Leucine-rich repeat (LRR) protein